MWPRSSICPSPFPWLNTSHVQAFCQAARKYKNTLGGNSMVSRGLGLECHLNMSEHLYEVGWWLRAGGFASSSCDLGYAPKPYTPQVPGPPSRHCHLPCWAFVGERVIPMKCRAGCWVHVISVEVLLVGSCAALRLDKWPLGVRVILTGLTIWCYKYRWERSMLGGQHCILEILKIVPGVIISFSVLKKSY